jgi:very-short-patch-repair endonuclease
MPKKGIVMSKRVSPELYARAKELRQKMTPLERLLWQKLQEGRWHGFHFGRQQVMGRFVVDFYCHKADGGRSGWRSSPEATSLRS